MASIHVRSQPSAGRFAAWPGRMPGDRPAKGDRPGWASQALTTSPSRDSNSSSNPESAGLTRSLRHMTPTWSGGVLPVMRIGTQGPVSWAGALPARDSSEGHARCRYRPRIPPSPGGRRGRRSERSSPDRKSATGGRIAESPGPCASGSTIRAAGADNGQVLHRHLCATGQRMGIRHDGLQGHFRPQHGVDLGVGGEIGADICIGLVIGQEIAGVPVRRRDEAQMNVREFRSKAFIDGGRIEMGRTNPMRRTSFFCWSN